MVHRDDIIRHLHRLAHAVACGQAPFPASRETVEATERMLTEAGLTGETQPDGTSSIDGCVVPLLVFAGAWSPWDIPSVFCWDIPEEDIARMEHAPSEAAALEMLREITVELYGKYLPKAGRPV